MKTLSILIPIYNEESFISRCLENITAENIPGWKKEIIVIDDGSTDTSATVLKQSMKTHQFSLLTHQHNQGKGAAIRTALQKSTGEVILIQDGDLEYDPSDYKAILDLYQDTSIKAVYGSRILGADKYHNYNANIFFYFGGITLTKVVNTLFGTKLTDQPTGYKSWISAYNHEILTHCHNDSFAFEIELTALLSRHTQIKEIPIHYYPRTMAHGKKINIFDFIFSLLTAFRIRFLQ